jgi:hypothetical protein
MTESNQRFGATCPVCDASRFTLLSRVWRNYHLPAEFHLDSLRWFGECDACGTVVMLPLHDDFATGGTVYYDQRDTAAHVRHHFEQFQKPNYDHIREFLRATHPAGQFHRWLDVGSVGYPTTFDDYEFTTIEPDAAAARAGEALFQSGRIHASTLDRWRDDQPYDGVLFNNSFYCLTDPGAALQHARQMLRPGGHLVITLSMTFADATYDREDGRTLLIEDLIVGETLQVYYNQFSLRYLAERHGFRLVDVREVKAYGCKTMMAHTFECGETARVLPELIPQSKVQMTRVWRECLDGFERSIAATVASMNRPETVLAGPLTVIRDLCRRGDLSRIRGILPVPDAHLAGAVVNGLRVVALDELRDVDPDEYHVVVCGFSAAESIAADLRAALGEDVRVSIPTRRSGMDFIDFSFRDGIHPSKGLVLREQPRSARRVRLGNRRVVVYGAGAGGHEAIVRLGQAGISPVAVCDGDPAKHGSSLGQHVVSSLDDVAREAYDLVVVASRPGYAAIAERLVGIGLRESREFVRLDDLPSF